MTMFAIQSTFFTGTLRRNDANVRFDLRQLAYIRRCNASKRNADNQRRRRCCPNGPNEVTAHSQNNTNGTKHHIICVAYIFTVTPAMLMTTVSSTHQVPVPSDVDFAFLLFFFFSTSMNGLFYICLHSAVRNAVRNMLSLCR